MRAIIIGAGRGSRLMPTTENAPKCFAEIQGKRILDWTVEALKGGGCTEICFIGGYRIEAVQRDYPDFVFRENRDWANNNILVSLMCAEDLMDRAVRHLLLRHPVHARRGARTWCGSTDELALGVDTDWREHYRPRTQHPPHDAEKVITRGGQVERVHRAIPYEEATGEFIGVAKFGNDGARRFRDFYHRRKAEFWGKPYREAAMFQKAYLIHMFQDMIEQGMRVRPCRHAGQVPRDRHAGRHEPRPDTVEALSMPASALPLFPASIVGSIPRPLVVRELIEKAAMGRRPTSQHHGCRHPLRRRAAGARRPRRGERRRMAAALLYRRHRRAGARLHARDQSRRRPAVDRRDREALAQARRLHRRRGGVREEGRARSPPRSPCPRRRCSASGCGMPSGRRRPIPTATTSCAPAWRRCGPRSRCCRTWASTSCRSTIRTSACSSIPTCARRYDDPDRAADFAVDMINETVRGLRRHQVRRPSLPPGRRAGARREASCRHLRADPRRSSTG